MVNSEEFINRLKNVIQHYQLTASVFADKIEVQRSSISHILSGRNKPSLDFILKVTNTFKDVDIYWLLNGKGTFPKKTEKNINIIPPTLFAEKAKTGELTQLKKIQKIVVFYNDGTFEEFNK